MDCVHIIVGDFNSDLKIRSRASTMINDFLSSRNIISLQSWHVA